MTTNTDTFKQLYFQEFGVMLTDNEAERKAAQLKRLYVVVYGSPGITHEEYEKEASKERGDRNRVSRI